MYLSLFTNVQKLNFRKYNTSKTSKHDQFWDNIVQSVFVWLIKAKRDFDKFDQFYKFHEKKFFLTNAHVEYKKCIRRSKV
jgi:hypothetical protein